MPDFTVRIQRTVTHYCDVAIKAKDEDAADEKANALADDYDALSKLMVKDKAEWELEDETYEVLEVNEE